MTKPSWRQGTPDAAPVAGSWWLPRSPDRRTPGELVFDHRGVRLRLYGALRYTLESSPGTPPLHLNEWATHPVVFGQATDRTSYSLFEVHGAPSLFPPELVSIEEYWVSWVAMGKAPTENAFRHLYCSFEDLAEWASAPHLTSVVPIDDRLDTNVSRVTIAKCSIDDATLEVVSSPFGSWDLDQVRLERHARFQLEFPRPLTVREMVSNYVRPLQDLLLLCLERHVQVVELAMMPATDAEGRLAGPQDVFFPAIAPAPLSSRTWVRSPNAPTVLLAADRPVPLGELLGRWFVLWLKYRRAITHLHSSLYAPFMFSETRFGLTFQSLEALHDVDFAMSDLPTKQHRERVERVVTTLAASDLEAEDLDWASRILSSRNDVSLTTKVTRVLEAAGDIGERIVGADPAFARTVAQERAGVSHGGGGHILTPEQRHWYGEALRWVVRARLLGLLLEDEAAAQRRVCERLAFQHAVERLPG